MLRYQTLPKGLVAELAMLANRSDVFGAMGSWNDSPPCYAHEMGLDKEYNSLSDRLLQQIRYHLMYVTNECWKKTEA